MIQIEDVVVSFDVLREKFLCNLDACKGECCIEGDAGAPVELDEVEKLEEVLPIIWEELSPEARAVIEKQGVVYTDQEGDLVTSIVNNKDCVFTCYDEKGCCYCAIEKAYRDGKTDFYKPVSCHLYPIRIGDYGPYKAVNYHRWDVCKAAVLLGKKENVAVYQFLKEPLIRKFGEKWYQELEVAVKELKAHDMILYFFHFLDSLRLDRIRRNNRQIIATIMQAGVIHASGWIIIRNRQVTITQDARILR